MPQPIKVCFVIPKLYAYFNPDFQGITYGGAERQGYYLIKKLAQKSDFQISACVADFGQETQEIYQNITVYKSFKFEQPKIIGLQKLYQTLKKINADIYVFRSADVGVAIGMFLVKWIGKRIFYMVANDDESNAKGLAKCVGSSSALLMGKAYPIVDILTVQSNFQKEKFQEFRGITPNEIIRNIYKIAIPINKINYKEKKIILWVGRCHTWKQPEHFLELARQNPQETFKMIAPKSDDEAYFHQIKTQVQAIPNLEYIDFVAPHKIKKYYQQCKIYVITSVSEGFANTMMEAMESCCAISSLNINPDNIIEKYQMGTATKDVDKFYQNFKRLVQNPEKTQEFGRNARKYLEENHQEDQIIEKFARLLRQ